MLEEDVNLIEDDNFLNKDVSELIVDDYYLFDMQDTPNGVKLYFYKDGIVFVSDYTTSDDASISDKFEYTSGSLQGLVEKFKENVMKHKFKELSLEMHTDNLGRVHVRLDNVLNDQYINVLTTTDRIQAIILYQDLYDVLSKHEDS